MLAHKHSNHRHHLPLAQVMALQCLHNRPLKLSHSHDDCQNEQSYLDDYQRFEKGHEVYEVEPGEEEVEKNREGLEAV